jgi:Eco57I restriction-modification methylase
MAILTKEQRNQLSKVVLAARAATEPAARKALHSLGVDEADAPSYLSAELRTLRRALRAQARQLGDKDDPRKKGSYDLHHLTEKIAYDQWHRMLFARFLAENELLISPDHGVAVSLDECRELAPEIGLKDEWDVAVRFAAKSLPQIFRPDDPAGKIDLAPEDRASLRDLVVGLSRETFLADDSLGWCYQFWQAERKDQVNAAGNKIGADELPAVTQLFTEDYMVDFLLDNTLGAWWAGRCAAVQSSRACSESIEGFKVSRCPTEEAARKVCALPGVEWKYLRFVKKTAGNEESWTPAAGTFDGWPKMAEELKCLDPCMGSGHFVVAMFERLVALRMGEEKLDETAAVAAVIRDNLFGLEIDPRCTQIAAFNLALAAWRRVGYCALPAMNLACSGLAPNAKLEDWLKIAGNDQKLQRGMERLYRLFQKAAVLGSLINPRAGDADLLVAAFHELQPLLEKALAQETTDDTAHEMAVTAQGLAKAAEILAGQFTLVATNVPYLGRGRQDEVLQDYCERVHPEAKADLATCFVERCLDFCANSCSTALVTPQNWLFLGSYKKLRAGLLEHVQWDVVARLGPRAFETIGGEVVNVCLVGMTRQKLLRAAHFFAGFEASEERTPSSKAELIQSRSPLILPQDGQLKNPDCRVVLGESEQAERLSTFADSFLGLGTGDYSHYGRCFWELSSFPNDWAFQQGSVEEHIQFGGREYLVYWDGDTGRVRGMSEAEREQIHNQDQSGQQAWGKVGVCVSLNKVLPVTHYSGELFDKAVAVLVPKRREHLLPIRVFAESSAFQTAVRALDQKTIVANGTLLKVPFDLAHWQNVAAEKYPQGLPKPFSNDPTQWLFNGQPKGPDQPFHVAVARLLGYQWPRQTGSSFPDCPALGPDGLEKLADDDGIVCINPIKGEQPAAERLRALFALAFGSEWAPGMQNELLEQAGFGGKSIEDWLRNGFFEQHCQLFHQRPFIWHIWDGRRDGFSALVNYHKLNRSNLEKLTYTFLGDWIARQKAANDAGEEGSDARLQAAQELKSKLEKIIEGEAPYDIFVRWKALEKQPTGWEPDLNDGVRLNIRPFVEAGVLRKNPKVNWNKDRGKDVASAPWYKVFKGDRNNDHHLSLAEKRKARGKH